MIEHLLGDTGCVVRFADLQGVVLGELLVILLHQHTPLHAGVRESPNNLIPKAEVTEMATSVE